MDCKTIQLSILEDEEAWALFQMKAHISEATSNTLKLLARQISDECKGLPVAIAAVASTLKDKDEVHWEAALGRLRGSKRVNIEKGLPDPYACLRLSYDNLDNEEAKSLFFLCSVFPEDYEIPVEDLTSIAIGLGVVGEIFSYEGARKEVSVAKNKLISSCLLLDVGEESCVKMHDLVRDTAHWIAKDENKVISSALGKNVTTEYRSPTYLWCEEFPNKLDCSNLTFLCINTHLEVSDESFKGMGNLRVLFLSGEGSEKRPLSTTLFKWLTNIHCLFLCAWQLGDISFLGDLKRLESLTVRSCSFLKLPDAVVAQLTNLRSLELSDCEMEINYFEGIAKHQQLEELYIIDYRSEWDDYDKVTAEFFKKYSVPQALQRYKIILGTRFQGYKDEFFEHQKFLCIPYLDASYAAIMDLAKKAGFLAVENIKGSAKNIIPDIFQMQEGMNELTELIIGMFEELECLVDFGNHLSEVGTLFLKLLSLRIETMKNLRALWHGVLPPTGLFEKLKELHLNGCPKLTSVFSPTHARSLVQLEKLKIWRCDELKHIVSDDGTQEISTDDHRLLFPKLKLLRICGCENLEYIMPVTYVRGLVQLEALEIMGSGPKMKYVFGQCTHGDQSQNEMKIEFPTLEELELVGVPNIVSILPENCYATWPPLRVFRLRGCPNFDPMSTDSFMAGSKVGKQFEMKDIKGIHKYFLTLEDFYAEDYKVESIFSLIGGDIVGQPVSLGLRYMELYNLSQMTSICVGSKNSFAFQNLKSLKIERCAKLQVIFPACVLRCPPKLEELEISDCKELKHIIEDDVENQKLPECFPKLHTLAVKQCCKLKRFMSVSASNDLPNLEVLIPNLEALAINGASELEELVGCEQGQCDEIGGKVKIVLPKLKFLLFTQLPRLCQGVKSQSVRLCLVEECPKVSLSSTASLRDIQYNMDGVFRDLGFEWFRSWRFENFLRELLASSVGLEAQSVSGIESPSSETYEESEKEFVDKVGGSKIPAKTTSQTDPELIGKSSPMLQELDPMPEKTSQLQMNNEDPATCESELPSSQTNGTNQSMLDDFAGSVYELNQIEQDILAKDARGLEQDSKPHEGKTRTSPCQKMQNVNDSIQEASNLMDKEGEVVSKDGTVVQRNEEPEKELVGRVSISEIPAIATSVTDSESVETPSPSPLDMPLHNTHSNSLKKTEDQSIQEGLISEKAVRDTATSTRFLDPVPATSSVPDLNPVLPDLAALLPPDDAATVSQFASAHPGFLLDSNTFTEDFRGIAYGRFAAFLRLLRSHKASELLGPLRSSMLDRLRTLRNFGFVGQWLDDIQVRLSEELPPIISAEDYHNLLDAETDCSQRLSALRCSLSDTEAELANIASQRKAADDSKAIWDAPFAI